MSTCCRSPLEPREWASMLLTMPSARRPCSAILPRLPVSIWTISSISARVSSASAATAGCVVSFSSSSNSTERSAKLLTKLSGFLISWAMPAVSLPRAAIFCACKRLACAACNSRSGVARRPDLRLGALALGDVGVDQHKAPRRHRVAPHLDDPTVRARALEAHLPVGIFDGAPQLRFEIGRVVLPAIGEVMEIFGIAQTLGEEGIRQIEHLLEIVVPSGEMQFAVEHRDAVAHIVEGHAQL